MILQHITLAGRNNGYQTTEDGQKVVCIISGDTYAQRELLKSLNYQWIPEQKHWIKMLSTTKTSMANLVEDAKSLGLTRQNVSTDMTKEEAQTIMQTL